MKDIIDYICEAKSSKELFPHINQTLKYFFENKTKGSDKELDTIEVPYKYNYESLNANVIYHFYDDLHTLLNDMLNKYLAERDFMDDQNVFCIAFSDCTMKISTCGYDFRCCKNPKSRTDKRDHVRFFVLTYNNQKDVLKNIDDYGKFEWREEFVISQDDVTEDHLFKLITDKVNSSNIATNANTDAYDIEFTGKRILKGIWTSKVVKKECDGDIKVTARPKKGGNWEVELHGAHKGYYDDINNTFIVTTLNNIGKVIDWIVKPSRYKKSYDVGPDGEARTHFNKIDKKVPKEIKDIFVEMTYGRM